MKYSDSMQGNVLREILRSGGLPLNYSNLVHRGQKIGNSNKGDMIAARAFSLGSEFPDPPRASGPEVNITFSVCA